MFLYTSHTYTHKYCIGIDHCVTIQSTCLSWPADQLLNLIHRDKLVPLLTHSQRQIFIYSFSLHFVCLTLDTINRLGAQGLKCQVVYWKVEVIKQVIRSYSVNIDTRCERVNYINHIII